MAEVGKDIVNNKETMALVDYKAVTFTLAGKDYGVDIMSVREISRGGRFTYVPNTPHFVRGVYNLRGEIIPVVDLRDFFGLPVNKEEKVEGILICRVKDTTLGLVVDYIEKVIGIDHKHIQPAHPMFAEINIQYIEGIIDRDDRLYVLLNIHQIFGIAKDLIDEELIKEELTSRLDKEEIQAPSPVATDPVPVEKSTPAVAPVASQKAPSEPVATPTPPVISQPETMQLKEDEPFVTPMQESAPNHVAKPDAQTQALLDMLNNMPEPEGNMLLQPDIEDLLSDGKFQYQVAFQGDDVLFDELTQRLFQLLSFRVTNVNINWITQQANHYLVEEKSLHFEEESEALAFLDGFFSKATGQLWDKSMMEEFTNHLTPQDKGIYHVWNPGCGSGHESYSLLGAVLAYGISNTPKIYAQDIDLIAISQAPHLSFQSQELPENFDLLTIESSQGLQFKNEFKNSIIFEFSDVTNHNTFPNINVIVARDLLSYLTEHEIAAFLDNASENTAIGTIMVLGDHEVLHDELWKPIESKYLSLYKKIK